MSTSPFKDYVCLESRKPKPATPATPLTPLTPLTFCCWGLGSFFFEGRGKGGGFHCAGTRPARYLPAPQSPGTNCDRLLGLTAQTTGPHTIKHVLSAIEREIASFLTIVMMAITLRTNVFVLICALSPCLAASTGHHMHTCRLLPAKACQHRGRCAVSG